MDMDMDTDLPAAASTPSLLADPEEVVVEKVAALALPADVDLP